MIRLIGKLYPGEVEIRLARQLKETVMQGEGLWFEPGAYYTVVKTRRFSEMQRTKSHLY